MLLEGAPMSEVLKSQPYNFLECIVNLLSDDLREELDLSGDVDYEKVAAQVLYAETMRNPGPFGVSLSATASKEDHEAIVHLSNPLGAVRPLHEGERKLFETDLLWRRSGKPAMTLEPEEATRLMTVRPTARGLVNGAVTAWHLTQGLVYGPEKQELVNGIVAVYSKAELANLVWRQLGHPISPEMLEISEALDAAAGHPMAICMCNFGPHTHKTQNDALGEMMTATQFLYVRGDSSHSITEQVQTSFDRAPDQVKPLAYLNINLLDRVFGQLTS